MFVTNSSNAQVAHFVNIFPLCMLIMAIEWRDDPNKGERLIIRDN